MQACCLAIDYESTNRRPFAFPGYLWKDKSEDGVRKILEDQVIPLDRLLVETDAPFLTPEPYRTIRPNEPRFVVHVADALAAIWSRPPNEVRHALFNNARRFFAIDPVPDL